MSTPRTPESNTDPVHGIKAQGASVRIVHEDGEWSRIEINTGDNLPLTVAHTRTGDLDKSYANGDRVIAAVFQWNR